MVEKIIQQPQAQLEQAEITAVAPMNQWQPTIFLRDCAQVNDPQISQTGSDHQPLHPPRIAQMASVQLKSPAFLVRKERFDVHPFAIPVARPLNTGHVADQVNRLAHP